MMMGSITVHGQECLFAFSPWAALTLLYGMSVCVRYWHGRRRMQLFKFSLCTQN